ncbi:MAG: S8 family peptidase, partial [Planctomycetes bacterium]|nr:S8 family peptidase [Planctomycetota bacterium]
AGRAEHATPRRHSSALRSSDSPRPASNPPIAEPAIAPESTPDSVERIERRSKISPELLAQIDRSPASTDRVRVIVQNARRLPGNEIRESLLDARQGLLSREFAFMRSFAAELPVSEIEMLAASGDVVRISSDAPVTAFSNVTVPTVGADQAWLSTTNRTGVNGTGVTVAVIDSGGRSELVDLQRGLTKRVKKSIDLVTLLPEGLGGHPEDNFGHGTHVAGIIGGDGEKSQSYSAHFLGIAPDCDLVSVKVLGDDGSGLVSTVIAGIAWCILNRDVDGIRVINLSLGHPVYESYSTDPLTRACELAVDAGIVVVCSAGNNGSSDGRIVYGGINSPGNSPWVITVGSVDTQGTVVRSDDDISPFSSRGPTAVDGMIKPDIVAPGRRVVALLAPRCRIATDHPELVIHGSDFRATGVAANEACYMRLSGTSMSTPVVTGAVALMLQKNPSLTPNAVKAVLMYTAQKMKRPNVFAQGAGYLNVEGAVRLAGEIRGDSNQLATGSSWLRNGSVTVKPYSRIAGERILWGSSLLDGNRPVWGTNVDFPNTQFWGNGVTWDDAIMWAHTASWDDPLMTTKQAAYGASSTFTDVDGSRSIMWSNAIMWSNSNIVEGDRSIMWSNACSSDWNGNMVDPLSIGSATSVGLPEDESAPLTGFVIGPLDAWFYPKPPQ